jgi:hypothetical protein
MLSASTAVHFRIFLAAQQQLLLLRPLRSSISAALSAMPAASVGVTDSWVQNPSISRDRRKLRVKSWEWLEVVLVSKPTPRVFFLGKSTRTNFNFKKYVITRFCSCENTVDLADL